MASLGSFGMDVPAGQQTLHMEQKAPSCWFGPSGSMLPWTQVEASTSSVSHGFRAVFMCSLPGSLQVDPR